ncbi:MAG: DUF5333 family protein [Pseudomonadota bacterium]
MTPLRTSLLAALLGAGAASAEAVAPDYYLDALFAVTTAERLAQFCPEVDVSLAAANAASEALLSRLAEDGLVGDALTELSGVEYGVGLRQASFMERHGLNAPSVEEICAAAEAEMAEGSALGGLLMVSDTQAGED